MKAYTYIEKGRFKLLDNGIPAKLRHIRVIKRKSLGLRGFLIGAEDEARTRDPNLGKVVLYQLSYFRSLDPFSKGMQRYNFLRFPGRNRRESSEGLSVPFDFLLKHRLWSYPYAAFSVHGLIYDHFLEGFRMFC